MLGVSEYFDAGSHEDVAVGLDPDLDRSATLTATAYTDGDGTFDAAADTPSLFEGTPVSDDARITVETPPPEPTYYQVDFVAGTDRRTRRERAVRRAEPADAVRVRYHDAGTTGKDTARPSQRVRTRLDYGHIRADDATATVEFTVNESCPTRRSRWRSTRCPARRSTRVPTSRNR